MRAESLHTVPSEPLRIVHVVRGPIGGILRHIADLARAQTDDGHHVALICDALTGGERENGEVSALSAELAGGVSRMPMRREISPRDLVSALAVVRRIRVLRPDVVHAHGAKGGVFGRLAAMALRAGGRPVAAFYAPHGGSLHYEQTSLGGRLYFTVERALERVTDGLIHVSAYEAAAYRAKVGVPRCPAHVVRNGLRPEEFAPVSPAAAAADFLYVGVLRDLKGVDLFIQALALLKAAGEPASAVIVGEGEAADEARYRAMVAEAGLEETVRFLPARPARQAFELARCLVVPSRGESLPYILLESAAAGLPVIATRVGGIPEIFAGETEKLVEADNPARLARAMETARAHPLPMAEAARVRRERLKKSFSLSAMWREVEVIYREALARRRGARWAWRRRPVGAPR